MALVTLARAKQQCRVTHDLENDLIQEYIYAAQEWIQNYLNVSNVPATYAIKAACLLIVHDLYNNRGATGDKDFKENPAIDRLLHPYRENMGI